MNILVINSGSSSVKFQVFDMADEKVLCKGIAEKIGTKFARLKMKTAAVDDHQESGNFLDQHNAIARILEIITDPRYEILKNLDQIQAVGHRVVHGGEYFTGSMIVTSVVLREIEKCAELAPLHNPPNIRGIKVCQELLPEVPQVVVFDTAFHHTMKPHVFLYGLPKLLYDKYKIRRYGFHGTSHYYAAHEAAKYLGKPIETLKIITCHLGNGASITATSGGRCIDTSMGFTPLEGLLMGTRCGDLDPAIIPYLIEKDNLSLSGVNNLMNKHSGVLGVAGLGTSDMRDLEQAAGKGEEGAVLARTMYAYRVKKYIGAYTAALGGLDILVFTGGIGENDYLIRTESLQNLEFLGIVVDPEKNLRRNPGLISQGPIPVIVVKADEELVIARESVRIVSMEQSRS
ncbi:acetate kinase [bacterium]|nr:acetate kinase [candidate division CSSED10-310 bacterium]